MPENDPRTVGQVGEFALIDSLTDGLTMPPDVSIGPGDDAACFTVDGECVISVDMFIENVHFRRNWCEPDDVGHKVVAAAMADVEAMGANPLAIIVGLSLPRDTELAWVQLFNKGLRAECRKAGAGLIGGDVSGAPVIAVSVTAIGDTAGILPVKRSGARPGQVVAIAGRLGWAAAGLAALGRGFRSPKAVVDAYRIPAVPYGQGREAAISGASAMIDVSDGLLADLGHIAQRSGVAIDLDSALFEVPEPVAAVAQALGVDPLSYVLTGGEDHSLAAVFDDADVPDSWRVVGQVLPKGAAEKGRVLVDGLDWAGAAGGWSHF